MHKSQGNLPRMTEQNERAVGGGGAHASRSQPYVRPSDFLQQSPAVLMERQTINTTRSEVLSSEY